MRHGACETEVGRPGPGDGVWRAVAVGGAVLTVLLAGVLVGAAGAEVGAGAYPTSQAIAADAQFLEYAPPPAQPGVVCLVDSGVDPNPDTTPALVGAEAEIPDWGTGDGLTQAQPPVEGHPTGHGTEMAMVMAAPQNGWGMVGIAPTAVRVYSIRVLPPGQTSFPFSAYTYAINRCLKLHITSQPAVTVINLSLGGTTTPPSTDLAFLADPVDTARQHGLNVVGAAGNDGGNSVDYPAAYSTVLAVGAGDTGDGSVGVLCGFSNRGGLDVIAPGCNSVVGGIDQAFADDGTPAAGFGTSQAAAITAAVLAAMRAYSPSLSVPEVELCLTATEQNGGNIDAAAAFRACGLGSVVDAGLAATPSAAGLSSDSPAGPTGGSAPATGKRPAARVAPTAVRRLAPPHLARVRRRGGGFTVRVLNRPRGASLEVRVLAKGHTLTVLAVRTVASNTATFSLRTGAAVEVRFVSGSRTSRWITRKIG